MDDPFVAPTPRRGLVAATGAALACVVALSAAPSAAQDSGDAAEGRRLARAWCSGCHRVDPAAPGPASDAVPGFPAIAAMPSTTKLSIEVFLRTPHGDMPDLKLTQTQIDDVAAYILSLRGR